MIIIWIKEYFLYILLAVASIFGFFWLTQYKNKLNISEGMALVLSILHTLVGVVCVKVFSFLESFEPGGMSLFGAIFFMPIFYFAGAKIFKRKTADVFDIFTICILFTLLCARINCIKSGCCLGCAIPGTDELRGPTRELEIVFYIVMLVWLGRKAGKPKFAGRIYPLYMISYGAFRFVEEWFRETTNPVGFFHISHIWALISIAVGAGIYYYQTRMAQSKKSRKEKSFRRNKEEKK